MSRGISPQTEMYGRILIDHSQFSLISSDVQSFPAIMNPGQLVASCENCLIVSGVSSGTYAGVRVVIHDPRQNFELDGDDESWDLEDSTVVRFTAPAFFMTGDTLEFGIDDALSGTILNEGDYRMWARIRGGAESVEKYLMASIDQSGQESIPVSDLIQQFRIDIVRTAD